MDTGNIVPPQSQPEKTGPLGGLPPYDDGNGWKALNPLEPGVAVRPSPQTSDAFTGECVTEWSSNIGGLMHGRTYSYPDTEDGRELLAQRFASRWDEVWNSYTANKFWTDTNDSAGLIRWATGKASGTTPAGDHAGLQETRSMRIWREAAGHLIMTEAWAWDASDSDLWRARIEAQIWYAP